MDSKTDRDNKRNLVSRETPALLLKRFPAVLISPCPVPYIMNTAHVPPRITTRTAIIGSIPGAADRHEALKRRRGGLRHQSVAVIASNTMLALFIAAGEWVYYCSNPFDHIRSVVAFVQYNIVHAKVYMYEDKDTNQDACMRS